MAEFVSGCNVNMKPVDKIARGERCSALSELEIAWENPAPRTALRWLLDCGRSAFQAAGPSLTRGLPNVCSKLENGIVLMR